jgi:hypothetical protein
MHSPTTSGCDPAANHMLESEDSPDESLESRILYLIWQFSVFDDLWPFIRDV